jgi:single-strand DNA-binding protein
MNSTVITGNLVRDPELRSTVSGTAVANFSVADNRRWADPLTGERREATTYVDVVAWGDLGRHVAESLRLGDRVTVSGRLEQRSWQTDQGERRSKLELTAADVAASLRWATVAVVKPERGAESSQDQDYEYNFVEEKAAEGAHPEAQEATPDPSVKAKATQGPVVQPAQQPAAPPPRRAAARSTGDLGR